MSFEYSSCFSLSSPNIRSDSTSEKPMMALSGVRNSWDMFARNSGLVLAGHRKLPALFLDLLEHPGILRGNRRLGRERLEQVDSSDRDRRPGHAIVGGEDAHGATAGDHGHHEEALAPQSGQP